MARSAVLPVATVLALFSSGACRGAAVPPAQPVRVSADTISFAATVGAAGFSRSWGLPGQLAGYHAVVWKGGRAAGNALFRAEVTDVQVLDALEALGGKPGNRLGMDTWDARKDRANPAADQVIAGPAVEILVQLPNQKHPVPLADLLLDSGGKGIAMRLGGHRANIDAWHSGCIACLYSCPGSKVGNSRYTVRDFMADPQRFRVKPGMLPPDGSQVTIFLRLLAAG